jgi:hypothetical protein
MHQSMLYQITPFILLSYVRIVSKMLTSGLLVVVKTSQRPQLMCMMAEKSRITFITRVPILLATVKDLSTSKPTHLTRCWALGALGLSMRTKSISRKHRERVGLGGVRRDGPVQLRNLTTLVLGRHGPKFNQS